MIMIDDDNDNDDNKTAGLGNRHQVRTLHIGTNVQRVRSSQHTMHFSLGAVLNRMAVNLSLLEKFTHLAIPAIWWFSTMIAGRWDEVRHAITADMTNVRLTTIVTSRSITTLTNTPSDDSQGEWPA